MVEPDALQRAVDDVVGDVVGEAILDQKGVRFGNSLNPGDSFYIEGDHLTVVCEVLGWIARKTRSGVQILGCSDSENRPIVDEVGCSHSKTSMSHSKTLMFDSKTSMFDSKTSISGSKI